MSLLLTWHCSKYFGYINSFFTENSQWAYYCNFTSISHQEAECLASSQKEQSVALGNALLPVELWSGNHLCSFLGNIQVALWPQPHSHLLLLEHRRIHLLGLGLSLPLLPPQKSPRSSSLGSFHTCPPTEIFSLSIHTGHPSFPPMGLCTCCSGSLNCSPKIHLISASTITISGVSKPLTQSGSLVISSQRMFFP